MDSVFRHLAQNGTWLDPTVVSFAGFVRVADSTSPAPPGIRYAPPGLREFWREQWAGFPKWPLTTWQSLLDHVVVLTRIMHESEVPILVGTDLGNPQVYPGVSIHEELGWLVKAGYTPAEALRAATDGAARFLGLADSLGTVAKGKAADLLLLGGNPLADIRNTERIEAVIARGRLIERAGLDSLLGATR